MLGALGVVFGDIGTSPLYTVQTVFDPGDPHPIAVSEATVFGIISLIFWSVTLVVTVTYVLLVMRADNDGEGGIMALITLLRRGRVSGTRRTKMLLAALGIFGASLLPGRRHDHAGDLRAVGGGGRRGGVAVARAPRRPDRRGHHRRPVHAAAPRDGDRRAPLRADHAHLVRRHRRVRRERHRVAPGDPRGAVADVRAGLLLQPLLDRVLRARGGRPRVHGRGGAVRRHGPLRPRADHARLAPARLPRLHAELPRPGRADPGEPEEHLQPVLPPRPRLGAVADGVPRGGRGGHRLAGGGDRRVLRRAPGDVARLPPAAADRPHVARRRWARSTSRRSTGCCSRPCSRSS